MDRKKDRQKNRQTLFYRTLSAMAGGAIVPFGKYLLAV